MKDLDLPPPDLQWVMNKTEGGFKIVISSDKLAKNIYLTAAGMEGFFSDNFFDILPGQTIEVSFDTNQQDERFEEVLQIVSLVDSY